eukprot:359472-Chlamydomonas_euryale.AAC.9
MLLTSPALPLLLRRLCAGEPRRRRLQQLLAARRAAGEPRADGHGGGAADDHSVVLQGRGAAAEAEGRRAGSPSPHAGCPGRGRDAGKGRARKREARIRQKRRHALERPLTPLLSLAEGPPDRSPANVGLQLASPCAGRLASYAWRGARKRPAVPGRGWGADGRGRGRGRVALSATVARRSHDGSRFRRRSRDGSRDAGLEPPAGGPRPSGDPSRMKSCARPVGDHGRAW